MEVGVRPRDVACASRKRYSIDWAFSWFRAILKTHPVRGLDSRVYGEVSGYGSSEDVDDGMERRRSRLGK